MAGKLLQVFVLTFHEKSDRMFKKRLLGLTVFKVSDENNLTKNITNISTCITVAFKKLFS